ncbi:Basic helix-loop-helix DNA-binding superfamily protein, putative isoform 2 [Hibiscus syriacus]|uniref:Basic helix-loop-helix DNA-binding superfamily protein, putative isoform 2 n=1 Tax=Hibiscus syriacus TaxID=106335 RepID=A0A6A2XZ36_HIBSY|nr:transcription factor bHLH100-like [Hibiscus syriacus]KAE8664099.1 Basic helix-loop-helix DNA-binding superfamily protein, putative isoform 2 [Hibiscus syriacus]
MCALTPLFPVCEWPLDAPIGHNQISNGFVTLDDFHHFTLPHLPQLDLDLDRSLLFTGDTTGDDDNNPDVVKKLNHNASERDRRRKMNTLYSTLRSLLPPSEQSKRLSIPATVSGMLKYIPELQAQVEKLIQKKEHILSTISRPDVDHQQQSKRKMLEGFKSDSPFTVSVSKVSETEIAIQISTLAAAAQTPPLSTVLLGLEDDGLFLMDSSCFESFGGRIFYNLNFQVGRTYNLEAMVLVLNDKLLSLYGKREP